MKICLINPPFLKYKGVKDSGGHGIPLNLAYIASYIKSKIQDLEIKIIDAELDGYSNEDILFVLKKLKPDVIGITCTTPPMNHVFDLVKKCKKTLNPFIVLGGPHPTALPIDTLKKEGVDAVVIGEGEITFYEIIKCLIKGVDLKKIKGICYKDKKKVKTNLKRELITNLDSLPFPDRSLFDLDKYESAVTKKVSNGKSTGILTSRGCPFSCAHCISNLMWHKRMRFRSAINVFKEIKECVDKFDITEFNIYDDNFTVNKKRVIDLCKLIIKNNLKINWICSARIDTINEEILDYMKKAGCKKISFGLESGSNRVLRLMNKKTNLTLARKAIRLVNNSGIKVHASFILGNLGETIRSIKQTINFAKSLDLDNATFFIASPYPGSRLFTVAKENGFIKEPIDWSMFAPLNNEYVIQVQKRISKEDLVYWQKKAFKEFYFRPKYVIKRLKNINSFSDIKTLFKGFTLFKTILRRDL